MVRHSPIRVLFLKGNYDKTGGPETLLKHILGNIDGKEIHTTVIILKKGAIENRTILEAMELADVSGTIEWKGVIGSPLSVRKLEEIVRKNRIDIIYSHDMRANLASYLLTRFNNLPWIVHQHGWLGQTHTGKWRIYEAIDKKLIRHAKLVITGSSVAEKEVRSAGMQRVALVPNAIEIPDKPGIYETEAKKIREKYAIQSGELVVGIVGRVHPGKGHNVLLESMAELLINGVNTKLMVVGDGEELEELKRITHRYGIEKEVVFTGYVADVRPYISAMDILAVPSLKESLPLTALEAMAMGKPVIGSNAGDLPALLDNGKCGYLVPIGNSSALADSVLKMSASAKIRKRMGYTARRKIEENYSIESMVASLQKLIRETADARGNST